MNFRNLLLAAFDAFSPRRIFHSATLWRETLILKRCDRWRELFFQKSIKMCLWLPPGRFLMRPRQDVTQVELHHLGPRKGGLVMWMRLLKTSPTQKPPSKNSKNDGCKSGKTAEAVLDFGCRRSLRWSRPLESARFARRTSA